MPQEPPPGASAQPIRCWFCREHFLKAHVLRDGILRSRNEEAGGPYRLFVCPNCNRQNLCEKTSKGRWFASPKFRFSFFDYFFSQLLDPQAEDLLAAASWFRDNEDRRRHFFARDGDHRYTGKSFFLRLWPALKAPPERTGERRRHDETDEGMGTGGAHRRRQESGDGGAREQRDRTTTSGGIVSPYELLGLSPDADERAIHRAFQRLAIHYHPDKVYHLGEEFRRVAHQKFTELKDAYETLLRRRSRRE